MDDPRRFSMDLLAPAQYAATLWLSDTAKGLPTPKAQSYEFTRKMVAESNVLVPSTVKGKATEHFKNFGEQFSYKMELLQGQPLVSSSFQFSLRCSQLQWKLETGTKFINSRAECFLGRASPIINKMQLYGIIFAFPLTIVP